MNARKLLVISEAVALVGGPGILLQSQKRQNIKVLCRFPDDGLDLETDVMPEALAQGAGLFSLLSFRELAVFGSASYFLGYPKFMGKPFARDGFSLWPSMPSIPSAREQDLSRLPLDVLFKRAPNREDRNIFMVYVDDTLRLLEGYNDKVPPASLISDFTWNGLRASVTLNASGATQQTINWIHARLLGFTAGVLSRLVIRGILIGAEEEYALRVAGLQGNDASD